MAKLRFGVLQILLKSKKNLHKKHTQIYTFFQILL